MFYDSMKMTSEISMLTSQMSTLCLDTTSKQKQKAFPFLRLPSELRNRIYSLVAPTQTVRYAWTRNPKSSGYKAHIERENRTEWCESLLRVNRQIYTEFVTIWYRAVPYQIQLGVDSEIRFCGSIYHTCQEPPTTLRYVRELHIRFTPSWYKERNYGYYWYSHCDKPSCMRARNPENNLARLSHHLATPTLLLERCVIDCDKFTKHPIWFRIMAGFIPEFRSLQYCTDDPLAPIFWRYTQEKWERIFGSLRCLAGTIEVVLPPLKVRPKYCTRRIRCILKARDLTRRYLEGSINGNLRMTPADQKEFSRTLLESLKADVPKTDDWRYEEFLVATAASQAKELVIFYRLELWQPNFDWRRPICLEGDSLEEVLDEESYLGRFESCHGLHLLPRPPGPFTRKTEYWWPKSDGERVGRSGREIKLYGPE
ncbi:hypothetical protein BT63DRAFT_132475 [Microthyrium microscopicum]|uniref:F-box domain-containing protein n=1 Tax=Microthyrium microscopicum TaxID=703497 RepID=A0A6A6UP01_9PEZI|nr:hypothetical protein BT63DRAFT_132475 [Microthyrium microscopicum]